MAEVKPLKLVDQGGGVGALAEFGAGDTLPKSALPALSLADVSGLGGFSGRNQIINGGFSVNQRAVTGTVTLAAGAYGHDRWKAGAGGCTYTFATAANITTITISAGSLQQVVEGLNLRSGPHTLSWSGTASGRIGVGDYGASGITATVTGGANITVEFNSGTLASVQLELGTVATPFEHRPYGQELTLCQRYCYRIENGGGGQPICNVGFTTSTTAAHGAFRFPVKMRAAPTFSILGGNATSFSVLGAGGGDIALSALSVDQIGVDGCRLVATSSIGLAQGSASVLRAATSPIAIFSAEL